MTWEPEPVCVVDRWEWLRCLACGKKIGRLAVRSSARLTAEPSAGAIIELSCKQCRQLTFVEVTHA